MRERKERSEWSLARRLEKGQKIKDFLRLSCLFQRRRENWGKKLCFAYA